MTGSHLQKLIFIYNADSGLRNMVIDSLHKVISPKTYNCNLCDITFGVFNENKIWRKFRAETTLEMEFLHKDEFKTRYASKFGYKFDFPIVLTTANDSLEVFINNEELNTMTKAEDLVNLIDERVAI